MAPSHILLLLIAGLTSIISIVEAFSNEFTVSIEPGKDECFFVPVVKDVYLEIDYQVIDGDQGELDIDFHLNSPTGRRLIMESRKSDSTHRTKITEEGDYQICFDNTFSIFSVKTVFFEVSTESEDSADEDVWEDNDKAFYEGLRAEEIYDIQVQDIKDSVAKVRGQLTQAQQYQDQLRAFEARDRNVAESNFSMVNSWSMIHIGTLIITGIIQVFMVRSLFDEKSVIRKLWKQGKM